ncbi:unnamed protein product [Rotaria sordida]|uniref:Uncharacterized protein n=2 Tax=Rotaria sordida TaxID=392033 RepID=A0A814WXZ0_9BILA|nr:unnamed protein product [Rotaria sordida]
MNTNYFIELQHKFETFQRPFGFNYIHFLLIHLYNSSSSATTIIKTYPLYTVFTRLQRRLNLYEQEQNNYQSIIDAIIFILSKNNVCLTETVEQTNLNMNIYPISCLFRLYSPMHLILFMEPLILLNDERLNNIIKQIFINEYIKDKCDYIHFCIAHRKIKLLINLLSGNIQPNENDDNWLITKINAPSDRSWLPIHYASYVGDHDLVEKLCTQYSQLMDPFHFILPKSRMRDFSDNPFDYLLRASGMKSTASNLGNTVLNLHEDIDDDSPILPMMNNDEDDDEFLLSSRVTVQQKDSFTDEETIQVEDTDIPDADQLACPLNDDQYKESYYKIIKYLLNSKLIDIDGLNHNSLTKNTIDYFSRHQYANFIRTTSIPYIYYQCDALFTSTLPMHKSHISQINDDDDDEQQPISKLIYFITILNQHSLFLHYENFDQYLLQHLLDLHSYHIEKAFGYKIIFNQYIKGIIIEYEQINELTYRILIRYNIYNENDLIQIDINFFFMNSYIDQFADTYISIFHTPITMVIQNNCISIVDILLSNISFSKNTYWGTLAMYELEICIDQLFTRRGKINFDLFTKFCSSFGNIHSDEYIIQQRIFVHTLVTCIKYNDRTELEHLINDYTKIYYDSCEKYPTDIRHNILAYCIVRNQALILEASMSAFSSLNSNSSQLYMLPVSNLSSSSSKASLSTILNNYQNNKDKLISISTSINSIYSCSGTEYRQCRRIRNIAIANQQKQNPNQCLSNQDTSSSNSRTTSQRSRPRLSRFWRAIRLFQLGLRHRHQTSQYIQQINNSDQDDRRTTTGVSLGTIEENENIFHRADLEIAEPVYNELPTTIPIVPQPVFISFSNNDQNDDEYDIPPVNGQTLLHIAAKLPGHEDVVRVLIGENSTITSLVNSNGQIPLLCAIQASSTFTAQLLMEADPQSLITVDNKKSSIFHYCCENKNDVLLANILNLLRHLNSHQSIRVQVLQKLTEPNIDGQTPFSIACNNGSIKCLKQLFNSKWLLRHIQLPNLITSDGIKKCIEYDQIDIINYLVSDLRRFRIIISILIDVIFTEPVYPSTDMVVARRQYNVLEYAILLNKTDCVKIFVSVTVPKQIEKKPNVDENLAVVRNSNNIVTHEPVLHEEYKQFLTRYSLPFTHDRFNQMPIQRMLKIPSLVPFVPNLLEQFLDDDGIDLSVIDDCLCSKPISSQCIFGQYGSIYNTNNNINKKYKFRKTNWVKEHPLNLISECDYAPLYDHPLVITTVDSKANLFGNILSLFIILFQTLYVALYTGVTIITRTPRYYGYSYIDFENDTCIYMCSVVTNTTYHFDYTNHGTFVLFMFRLILFLYSCIALLKEFIQVLTQRRRYFQAFFLNLLEILTYSCGVIFTIDTNTCSKYSSIRCKYQYDFGALGVACVWTILLLAFVNSLKLGKYGLLFITIILTFIKFCFIYIFIWIGYLFAFHMLLTQNPSFETVLTSIPRMVAMLTGEFNFENLFFSEGEPIHGTTMAKIIFTTFVFVVHICLMNILIGLAVSDVADFQIHAKRENLRSRIRTVLNFQAKFGTICDILSKLMFVVAGHFPELLINLKFGVSKLSIRMKSILIPNHTTNLIHTRVGYVTMKNPNETLSNITRQKENMQEIYNEKLLYKVNQVREEIDKIQLKFTQELHRLTLRLSRLFER